MLHNIKQLFKSSCIFDNLYGFYCPDCAAVYEKPTAWVYRMWDEKQHKFKKYIQCEECLRTTPAFENKHDAVLQWGDQWEMVNGTRSELLTQ